MQYGRDENGKRIMPQKGLRSTCPLCQGTLIAKCGEIYTWHWQHYNAIDCDSWKEKETAWHINWKNKFKEREREVIIEQEGKRHIADVQTQAGMVIEFQNSPIAIGTIYARESFYKNMIWVINAGNFVEHLNIWSLVKKELKELNEDYQKNRSVDQYYYQSSVKDDTERIDKLNKSIVATKTRVRWASEKMKENTKSGDEIHQIAEKLLQQWVVSKPDFVTSFEALAYDLSTCYSQFKVENAKERQLRAELKKVSDVIDMLSQASSYPYNGRSYRIIAYMEIIKFKSSTSIAIEKSRQQLMFPTVHAIRSAEQLLAYQNKQHNFEFAIDEAPILEKAVAERTRIQAAIDEHNNDKPDYLKIICEHVDADYKKNYEFGLRDFNGWNYQLEKEESELRELNQKMFAAQQEHSEMMDRMDEENEKELEENRSAVMKRWKGLYGFRWKNERKSWSETGCPVFFDIGKDYLFQRLRGNTLKKISLEDFFKKYNPAQP